MTDQSNPPNAPVPAGQGPAQCRGRGRGRRLLFLALVVLAAGFTGALATRAFSEGFGFGPGYHYGRGHGFMGGGMDPAFIEDRADRMVRHLAVEVDATNEQQEKLRAIVKAAVRDIVPMREKARGARLQARTLLTQPTVDRAAIEKFRAEQVAAMDAFSKRIAQALADAAEVLTAEQRTKLNDRFPPFGGYWRGWHRG